MYLIKKAGAALMALCLASFFFFGNISAQETQISVDVPIIMYHRLMPAAKPHTYTITPEMFEQDLVYLQKCGYHTVTMTDLINYVYNGIPLNEKSVMISFDDGDESVYKYAYPLLKKYNMKAVAAIIGGITDQYTEESKNGGYHPHMTWSEVREIYDSGYVEIQNHTYNLHVNGAIGLLKKQGEDDGAYEKRLKADLDKFQERCAEMIGFKTTTVAYPFGCMNKGSEKIIKELGYQATLSSCSGVNHILRCDPNCLYRMFRNNRELGIDRGSFFNKLGIKEE
ncbi:MAG: polysaccharide deacetylase family protein [Clostridiales bacterium]|jgi:peptidoglycan/xylan/chitin deacetylase (PgdA/CDA1 family)|nr:polysaccharide deacetylase family protein [Clostridiales bacterium]